MHQIPIVLKNCILLLSFLFGVVILNAQTALSLERCKELARKNNVSLQRQAIDLQNASLTTKVSKRDRLPSVSSSVSSGIQFGRTINPVENTFINQDIGFISFSVNARVPVYSGGRINSTIKRNELQEDIAQQEQLDLSNSIILEVARIYLDILQFQEQLRNAKNDLSQTLEQLAQVDLQIEAGRLPENERLSILVTQSTNEQTILDFETSIQIAYQELKFQLGMTSDEPIVVEAVEIGDDLEAQMMLATTSFYNKALDFSPGLKIIDLNEEVSFLDQKIQFAQALPSVSFFASASSNFSDILQQSIGVPFGDQINQNFGQSIGISLNIPIYNKGQQRLGIKIFDLSRRQINFDRQTTEQELKLNVGRSLNQLKLAEKTYEIAQRTQQQAITSYNNAHILFENGAINTLDLLTFQNVQQQAKSDVIRAKYTFLYQLEVLKSFTERL